MIQSGMGAPILEANKTEPQANKKIPVHTLLFCLGLLKLLSLFITSFSIVFDFVTQSYQAHQSLKTRVRRRVNKQPVNDVKKPVNNFTGKKEFMIADFRFMIE